MKILSGFFVFKQDTDDAIWNQLWFETNLQNWPRVNLVVKVKGERVIAITLVNTFQQPKKEEKDNYF